MAGRQATRLMTNRETARQGAGATSRVGHARTDTKRGKAVSQMTLP